MKQPTEVIGENYLQRWHLIPHNRFLNIYLHKFTGSDDDRALHDHPWNSVSIALKGQMFEHLGEDPVPNPDYADGFANPMVADGRWIKKFIPYFRKAEQKHRMELVDGPAWTLFITGPKKREWGFYTKEGWMHNVDFEKWYQSGNRGS